MKIYFSLITVVLLLAFTGILSPIYGQWFKYPIDDNFYRPTIVVVDDIDGDTDPETDEWSYEADLVLGRVGHTADYLNGKIYVMGGDPQSVMRMKVEEFESRGLQWSDIDSLPHPLTAHTSNAYENKIYVLTGSTDDIYNLKASPAVYAYDPLVVNITDELVHPQNFNPDQNYPNPFNPITIINYELPITNYVKLEIYNLMGQKVATLVNENQRAGHHQVEWNASGFASGVYYYHIQEGEFVDVKKMVLLR